MEPTRPPIPPSAEADAVTDHEALMRATMPPLLELVARMRRYFDATAASFDLSHAQARALRMLEEPAPMRDIAAHLHCDASNVTGIVDRLEERGLARREADPDDRRRKRIVLTAAGRDLVERFRERLQSQRPGIAGLDPDELETFRRLVEKSLANFPDSVDDTRRPQPS